MTDVSFRAVVDKVQPGRRNHVIRVHEVGHLGHQERDIPIPADRVAALGGIKKGDCFDVTVRGGTVKKCVRAT